MARRVSSFQADAEASMTERSTSGHRSIPLSLILSLRPAQWTKNLLVFAGLIFGLRMFEPAAVATAIAAFVIFCGLSGVVYLVNDIQDRHTDRQHPLKRHRPIAAGALPLGIAWTAAAVIAAISLGAAVAINRPFAIAAGGYLALQILYSGPLKHIVILDALTIALGFVLRAIAGALAVNVAISHWLLVCTILLALFLALAKRRHELVMLAGGATDHRPILSEYSPYLLDQMIAVVTASTFIAYIFYTISPETEQKFGTEWLGLTIPFPLYGIFRYLYLVHQREGGGSPADLLLNDRPLLACVTLWVVAVVLIIYHPFVP
ncbi:MAG: decaprenyl-phosphate phosphoribosyltransferase [Acidobacteriaceae bacterium]|jgi:4-hydroxybenzoate polyprenyltransferase|nr:decaprenyl-phosphate phosphoribosyltransferase [Acidobacteriaceae bacterium]